MTDGRCKERVFPDSRFGDHQCLRKAVKDGWCKQHHPDAVAARRNTEALRYEQKLKEDHQRRIRQAAQLLRGEGWTVTEPAGHGGGE